ncbi:LOG family protein [Micromonospora sp. NPDC050417]|uniref:LOG family protein n=1 Tax=Micromonospora sp. NPDC050417 TaxID=3364280 RepID=UPI00378F783B
MPTPPPTHLLGPDDTTEHEIESRAELDRHLHTGSLAGLTVQGLRLDLDPPPDLTTVELTNTLFIGCRFASRQVEVDLISRGAHLLPPFADLPYSTQPPRLYTPEELVDGFATGGFAGMFDTRVYEHFTAHGGALPPVREALAQRMHDHGMDNALADATRSWLAVHGPGSVIGVMGGHAVPRGSVPYRLAATLGWELARADRLVVTGGGPGVMEAANLGAYLSARSPEELAAAVDLLADAPDFTEHDRYTSAAVRVRTEFGPTPDGPGSTTRLGASSDGAGVAPTQRAGDGAVVADTVGWARRGGLSIPTWLYGHEPANLFAGRIAKYFSNAIREDTLLRLARGGIVFAAGRAGTVQEVFQAATKTFYGTDGASGAYVFLDRAFWTETLPVESLLRPLFTLTPFGDLTGSIHVTDDVHEAVRLLTAA